MYKIDTHVHTSESSNCAKVSASKIVNQYKKEGYSGIIITDHLSKRYFDKLDDLTWEEKIDNFLSGYKIAMKEGNRIGLNVLLGIEIQFYDSKNHYLVYGIDEEFLKVINEPYNIGIEAFKNIVNKDGGLIFQAHPYRGKGLPENPKLIDGLEVYNGSPRHDNKNHLANKFANNFNLFKIAGSDYHQIGDITSGIKVTEKIKNSKEFADYILNKKKIEIIVL